jgi:ABC-type bacteriocin/lantibiotic exporter with double-glycine peptidase domain
LASLALQVAGLVFPVASQILLDRVIIPRQEVWLWGLGIALGTSVLTTSVLALVRSYVVQGLQNLLDVQLLSAFLEHLLHLPLAFFLQRQPGDLVHRVQSNAIVRTLLGSQSISALLDGFLLVAYAALMLAYSPRLGLLILAFAAARVVVVTATRGRNQQVMTSELAAAGREGGALVEALTGLETTKASGAEARMVQCWSHRMTDRVNSALQRRRLAMGAGQVMTVLQGLTAASVFLVGGQEVVAERMTLGVFASFLALQYLLMPPLESLLSAVAQVQYLGIHLRRLDDVLETAREANGSVDPGRLRGRIALTGVSYAYSPGAQPVLQGVTLSIEPGERVAIVGRSGTGKSTLARLLLGMYLPSSGRIEFDGHDLRYLDIRKVRRQMGVVLQEAFLFDDTVRANLSLGDEEIQYDRLRTAAEMACVADVIEALPHGFDNRVGENGSLFSGGERQRLILARALAGSPSMVLLDEATSALDLETERRVHANLASLGCTRIVITHRMATVRDADRVLVLEGGRIVQSGAFTELVGIKGPLRTMVEARELSHS